MRPALALALVLLALTLALENAGTLFPRAAPQGSGRALAIVASAKGALLPPGRLGATPERADALGEEIRIGEWALGAGAGDGLRAAFVAAGGPQPVLHRHETFAVAGSAAAARALADAVEAAPEGELLVLASSGVIRPDGAEAEASGAELARLAATLGARVRPGAAERESWAWIGLRLGGGWVPLAEGWSDDSGVVLAFLLAPDLERYRGFAGDFVRVRAAAEVEVELAGELARAERTDGAEPTVERTVLGRALPGIALPPVVTSSGVAPGRVAWRDVAFGDGSGLVAWVGLDDATLAGAAAGAGGARLDVRVDGATVASQPVVPGAPWRAFQVDLRPFAGRRGTLELVVEPDSPGARAAVLLGFPLLVHGYRRSPLDALADALAERR